MEQASSVALPPENSIAINIKTTERQRKLGRQFASEVLSSYVEVIISAHNFLLLRIAMWPHQNTKRL